MQPDQTPRQVDSSTDRPASAQRRREILKRIGQTSILMGAATPLSALATNGYTVTNVRKWCKPSGTKIGASISGAMSVVISAAAGGQSYGQGCGHYKTNLPPSCNGKKFSDHFVCAGKQDSNGKYSGQAGCNFDRPYAQLFSDSTPSVEAHWAAAYCNSLSDGSGFNFPYASSEVTGFFLTDHRSSSAAYQFFCNNMEAGNTGL